MKSYFEDVTSIEQVGGVSSQVYEPVGPPGTIEWYDQNQQQWTDNTRDSVPSFEVKSGSELQGTAGGNVGTYSGGGDWLTAMIQGLFSLGSSALNYWLGEKSADKAYNRQVAQWHRENEYNTPANQRKRAEAAGLNFAAMLGGNALSNGSGSLSAVQQNPYVGRGVFGDGFGLSNLADTMLKLSQARNVEADTENKEKEGNVLDAQALNITNEAEAKALDNALTRYLDENGVRYEKAVAVRDEAISKANTAKYVAEKTGIDLDIAEELYDAGYHMIDEKIKTQELNIKASEAEILNEKAQMAYALALGETISAYAPTVYAVGGLISSFTGFINMFTKLFDTKTPPGQISPKGDIIVGPDGTPITGPIRHGDTVTWLPK